MNIVFKGSERPTLGVEIEVQLVDESGALATEPAATKILAELDDEAGFKHELLECTIEVITGVCPTVGHARKDLGTKVERLIEVADGFGQGSLPGPPFSRGDRRLPIPATRLIGLPVDRAASADLRVPHTRVGILLGGKREANSWHVHPALPCAVVVEPYWMARQGLARRRPNLRIAPTAGLPTDGTGPVPALHAALICAGTIRAPRGLWYILHTRLRDARASICDGSRYGRALRDRRAQ